MKTSEKNDKVWPAIVKTRHAMKSPKKDADNPGFKRDGKPLKYADLAAVIDVVDEACAANGLVTLQELTGDSAGVSVSNLIVHESGQWVQFDPLFVPASKLDAQGFGSAATYTRRYALKAVWNLADEDDDGNAATSQQKPATFTATAPKPTAAAPAGYHFLSDYKQNGEWHEAHLLNWDDQGGSLKISTKRQQLGALLLKLAQAGEPVKADVTMKKGSRGEAYLNAINSYSVDQALAPIPVRQIEPLTDNEIPF